MSYQSSANVPLWSPAFALLREHRGLISSLVKRDLTNRYKGSVMGLAWTIITPAIQILIFTVIFAGIFNARFGNETSQFGYAIYMFCGMLPWIAFSEGVQRSATALTENVNLVKRVVFPIEALPVNLALSAIAQQLFGTLVLIVVAAMFEHTLSPTMLLLPLLLVPQLLVTVGLGWLAASFGVFIRDTAQFTQLVLMAWMYLTPILYPEKVIPAQYRWLVELNPLAALISSYRRILLEGRLPDWRGLAITMAFALVCFGVGYWWFERTKKAFADVL
ncbi:MAG: ABC transporter permease [Acidobacteria bacterium]|nr:ABC transporter permease [Acidobacteriota bacterium]MBI3424315.1 ABC transporter permease [Acidobacteriota bacterium]